MTTQHETPNENEEDRGGDNYSEDVSDRAFVVPEGPGESSSSVSGAFLIDAGEISDSTGL